MGPIAWKMHFVSRTWAIWLPIAKYKLWNQVSQCPIVWSQVFWAGWGLGTRHHAQITTHFFKLTQTFQLEHNPVACNKKSHSEYPRNLACVGGSGHKTNLIYSPVWWVLGADDIAQAPPPTTWAKRWLYTSIYIYKLEDEWNRNR